MGGSFDKDYAGTKHWEVFDIVRIEKGMKLMGMTKQT